MEVVLQESQATYNCWKTPQELNKSENPAPKIVFITIEFTTNKCDRCILCQFGTLVHLSNGQ